MNISVEIETEAVFRTIVCPFLIWCSCSSPRIYTITWWAKDSMDRPWAWATNWTGWTLNESECTRKRESFGFCLKMHAIYQQRAQNPVEEELENEGQWHSRVINLVISITQPLMHVVLIRIKWPLMKRPLIRSLIGSNYAFRSKWSFFNWRKMYKKT